jgi:two-component system cell cycle response regulator DivK
MNEGGRGDTAARGATGRGPLVLVVDDYPDAQSVYGLLLRREGYRVAFAASGDEAVVRARQLLPDAVVMDLCLRGKDGLEATRELRGDARLERIPVVGVSGHDTVEREARAYAAGCDMFVTKACPIETLLSIVHGLIARSSVMRVAAAVDADSRASTVPSEMAAARASPPPPASGVMASAASARTQN